MRSRLIIGAIFTLLVSCSDGGYRTYDYPVYKVKLTTEQSNWVRFGISDSNAFIDTSGHKLSVNLLGRDTAIDEAWDGMPVYKPLQIHGVNYNYTLEQYLTTFNIDSVKFELHIINDSARLYYAEPFLATLSFRGNSIELIGPTARYKDTLVSIKGNTKNGLVYRNPSAYRPEKYREILIVPEYGILWIRFNNDVLWTNEIMFEDSTK